MLKSRGMTNDIDCGNAWFMRWFAVDAAFAVEHHTRMSLTTLPLELILCVFKCLDWPDILALRKTCVLLNQASKERTVFLELVTRYASIIPRTAFLPERPLSLYNSQGLEKLIYQWRAAELGWTTSDPSSSTVTAPASPTSGKIQFLQRLNPNRPQRQVHLDRPLKTFHLVDGGRWLLVVRYSGAVEYYDLHHPSSSLSTIGPVRQLIPDLTERRPWTVVLTAVDMDYKEPFLAFNLAIYTRIWLGFSSEQVQIWRVTLDLDARRIGVGLKATRLAVISPLGLTNSPSTISLCGHQLAWGCLGGDAVNVAVVDWTNPGSHAQQRPESHIPLKALSMRKITHPGRPKEVPCFQLIRGRILLAVKPWLILYDLASAPTFQFGNAITPHLPAHPNAGNNHAPSATPYLWRKKFSDLLTRSLSKAFFCPLTDTIRFIFFTRSTVYGLVLPTAQSDSILDGSTMASTRPEEIRVVRLGAYDMENEPCGFTSGYHTAVLHSFKPETVILRYRWPEELEPCALARGLPLPAPPIDDAPGPGGLLKQRTVAITCKYFDPFTPAMDEGSGRVIISAQSGKQLAVVDFAVYPRVKEREDGWRKEVF